MPKKLSREKRFELSNVQHWRWYAKSKVNSRKQRYHLCVVRAQCNLGRILTRTEKRDIYVNCK